jgi:hypothetical protein
MKGTSDDIFLEGWRSPLRAAEDERGERRRPGLQPDRRRLRPANDTVAHYLKTVGGPPGTRTEDNIFVLKANGS